MFTPTEAGRTIAVVYSTFVGVVVYRRLNFRNLPNVLLKAGLESGMVMLLIAMSEPFAWIVAVEPIPSFLIDWISTLTTSPWLILLFIKYPAACSSGFPSRPPRPGHRDPRSSPPLPSRWDRSGAHWGS